MNCEHSHLPKGTDLKKRMVRRGASESHIDSSLELKTCGLMTLLLFLGAETTEKKVASDQSDTVMPSLSNSIE